MKILSSLWQVGGGLSGPGDAAVYRVEFGDTAALIDAGCGSLPGGVVTFRAAPAGKTAFCLVIPF